MTNCLCGNRHCDFSQKLLEDEIHEIPKSQKIIFTSCNASLSVNDFLHVFMTGIRIINIDLLFDCKNNLLPMLANINEAIKNFEERFEFNVPITKICTLRGRTSRIGRIRNDQCWRLKAGDLIVLTCNENYQNCSTNEVCFVTNFKRIIPMLEICDTIEIKEMEFQVVKVVDDYVTCYISKSGILESHQKLSFPHLKELYHELLDCEIEDCKFAVENNFDFIIAPNVRHARYFHQLKKVVKESGIKMIAKIESELDAEVIEKIVEHFFATITTSGTFEDILKTSISPKKPIIARFPTERSLSRISIRICESVDTFIVKCNEIKDLLGTMKKLKKISEDIIKFSALNKQHDNLDGSLKILDEDKINYTHTNAFQAEPEVKAMVCIIHSGKAIREIAGYNNYRYILALTKDRTLAKRLHLFRNVLPMIYVDCGKKSEAEQHDELMMIALKFGKAMKIILSDEPVIERFQLK